MQLQATPSIMLSLTFLLLYVSALVHFYTEQINLQLKFFHKLYQRALPSLVEVGAHNEKKAPRSAPGGSKKVSFTTDNQTVPQVAFKPAKSKTAANLKCHSTKAYNTYIHKKCPQVGTRVISTQCIIKD